MDWDDEKRKGTVESRTIQYLKNQKTAMSKQESFQPLDEGDEDDEQVISIEIAKAVRNWHGSLARTRPPGVVNP